MNENDRKECSHLRNLSSADAATFILDKYTNKYPVTMRHRTWKRIDQIRLANRFLRGRAHAHSTPYDDFLSFMSINLFVKVVEDGLPEIDPTRLSLLSYNLKISFNRITMSDDQRAKVQGLLKQISVLEK